MDRAGGPGAHGAEEYEVGDGRGQPGQRLPVVVAGHAAHPDPGLHQPVHAAGQVGVGLETGVLGFDHVAGQHHAVRPAPERQLHGGGPRRGRAAVVRGEVKITQRVGQPRGGPAQVDVTDEQQLDHRGIRSFA